MATVMVCDFCNRFIADGASIQVSYTISAHCNRRLDACGKLCVARLLMREAVAIGGEVRLMESNREDKLKERWKRQAKKAQQKAKRT